MRWKKMVLDNGGSAVGRQSVVSLLFRRQVVAVTLSDRRTSTRRYQDG